MRYEDKPQWVRNADWFWIGAVFTLIIDAFVGKC